MYHIYAHLNLLLSANGPGVTCKERRAMHMLFRMDLDAALHVEAELAVTAFHLADTKHLSTRNYIGMLALQELQARLAQNTVSAICA